jgi:hypothetical protein
VECSSYTQAVQLVKRGPVCVINHPDTLMVWCTPLDRIAPDVRHEPLDPNVVSRLVFMVTYAVRWGRRRPLDGVQFMMERGRLRLLVAHGRRRARRVLLPEKTHLSGSSSLDSRPRA